MTEKRRYTPRGLSPAERLARYTTPDRTTGCANWTGPVGSHGYGLVASGSGKLRLLAHRLAWEVENGPIPGVLTVDHLCLNRRCVNPQHMEIVSRAENSRRGEKNRQSRSGGGWMAARAQCKNGHPLEGPEADVRMDGNARICRICARARMEKFKARRTGATQ